MSVFALALAIIAAGMAAVAIEISLKRNSAVDAMLEEMDGKFKAFMVATKGKVSDVDNAVSRLANADQALSSLTLKVEELSATVEGGLDDRIDSRIKPMVAKLNTLSLMAGLPAKRKVNGSVDDSHT